MVEPGRTVVVTVPEDLLETDVRVYDEILSDGDIDALREDSGDADMYVVKDSESGRGAADKVLHRGHFPWPLSHDETNAAFHPDMTHVGFSIEAEDPIRLVESDGIALEPGVWYHISAQWDPDGLKKATIERADDGYEPIHRGDSDA